MIELVIKIPEEMYAEVMDENGIDTILIPYSDLIKNGIPLPEHHGDLIDKDRLTFNCMADVDCDHKNCNTCQYKCVAKYEIENSIVLKKEESESE